MLSEQAVELAGLLCGAFGASKEQATAFEIVLKDFDVVPMTAAVKGAIEGLDRLPSVKALLARYYEARSKARDLSERVGDVPCEPCLREGGWRPIVGGVPIGDLNPPRAAKAPFLRGQRATDDGGKPGPVVWDLESCCPSHAKELVERQRRDQIAARDAERRSTSPDRPSWTKIGMDAALKAARMTETAVPPSRQDEPNDLSHLDRPKIGDLGGLPPGETGPNDDEIPF